MSDKTNFEGESGDLDGLADNMKHLQGRDFKPK